MFALRLAYLTFLRTKIRMTRTIGHSRICTNSHTHAFTHNHYFRNLYQNLQCAKYQHRILNLSFFDVDPSIPTGATFGTAFTEQRLSNYQNFLNEDNHRNGKSEFARA